MATDDASRSETFTATLELRGKTATGFVVPDEVVERLGAGKRAPVQVTVAGYRYRNTIGVMDGQSMISVSAEHRKAAGLTAGEVVEVTLTVDSAPRTVEVPSDFAEAMRVAGVTDQFDRLAYSHRKEHVRAVEDAKKPETRLRRIERALDQLR